MAAVLLTILKVIGIVLLCILGLLLALLLIILFVPIRYRISADKSDPEDDITAFARVSFLLHIISAAFTYNKGTDLCVRLFGIRIYPRKRKEDHKRRKNTSAADHPADEKPDPIKDENEYHTLLEDDFTIDWNDEEPSSGDTDNAFAEDDKESDIVRKAEELLNKLSDKYESIHDRYKKIRKDIRFWDRMIHDARNQNAVDIIKKQVVRLLKKIAPKRVKGFVHFGFDDPATTGQILVYLSVLYPVLPRMLKIDPGFSDTLLYGNVDIKGRLALITVAVAFLKVYFNKDFRRMYRLYKRHQGN